MTLNMNKSNAGVTSGITNKISTGTNNMNINMNMNMNSNISFANKKTAIYRNMISSNNTKPSLTQ